MSVPPIPPRRPLKPPRPRMVRPGRPSRSIASVSQLDSVPSELKDPRQWVLWKYELREGRETKVPHQADHQPADSSDPVTWTDFSTALQTYLNEPDFDGIGFVFTADDSYSGIDFDKCLNADGSMKPWATHLHGLLSGGYGEVSPSGTGIKIWVRGKLPGNRHKKTGFGEDGAGAVELYDCKRFFTVTGKAFGPVPPKIGECLSLSDFYLKVFPADPKSRTPEPLHVGASISDEEIIERAKAAKNGPKFSKLWVGDISDFNADDSAADLALLLILAFWTNRDPERMDRLFRRSGLYRSKWDRQDYRERTIAKAIESCRETYECGKDSAKQSVLQQTLACFQGDKLFADFGGKPHSEILSSTNVAGSIVVRPTTVVVGSKGHLQYMRQRVYQQGLTVPDANTLKTAADQFAARAEFEGERQSVNVRVARYNEIIIIDRNDATGEVVEITAGGVRVLTPSPTHFRRPAGALELPQPAESGSFGEFFDLLGIIDEATRIKIIAWLLGACLPDIPCPLLSLAAQQGAGKSLLGEMLVSLIDPQDLPLIGFPANETALCVAAQDVRVLGFDNASYISEAMSDAFCRIISGAGLKDRKFYSQDETVAFKGHRAILITSIGEVVTRPDLRERALVIRLSAIPEQRRKTEAEIRAAFERVRPSVLAAMYRAISVGLCNLASVQVPCLPRMADFAKFIVAAEPALPWQRGRFLEVYAAEEQAANEAAMENSAIGPALLSYLTNAHGWRGRSMDLLEKLRCEADSATRSRGDFPQSPRGLSAAIARIKKALWAEGWEVSEPTETNRGNVFTILPVTQKP